MDNPISRMPDPVRQSIIECFSTLELDWYLPETRVAQLCKVIKDSVLEENWEGLHNFIQSTSSAVAALQESNRNAP